MLTTQKVAVLPDHMDGRHLLPPVGVPGGLDNRYLFDNRNSVARALRPGLVHQPVLDLQEW